MFGGIDHDFLMVTDGWVSKSLGFVERPESGESGDTCDVLPLLIM